MNEVKRMAQIEADFYTVERNGEIYWFTTRAAAEYHRNSPIKSCLNECEFVTDDYDEFKEVLE